MLFLLIDLNPSQILSFEFNKFCNLFFYEKYGESLFKNLYIRINNTNNVYKISNYKLLCYYIYYIACCIAKFKLWYVLEENVNVILIQKRIIHTLVDLINSIMEVYARKEKDFMYEILGNKITNKFNELINNDEILNLLKKKEDTKIILNKSTNKIKFIRSLIKSTPINGIFNLFKDHIINIDFNRPSMYYINEKVTRKPIEKLLNNNLNKIKEKFLLKNLQLIAAFYDTNGNKRKTKLTDKEMQKIDKKELIKINDKKLNNIKLIKVIKSKYEKSKKVLNMFENDNFKKNINSLLSIFEKYIGKKINYKKKVYLLKEDQLFFNHNFLGIKLDKGYYLNLNDDKIKIKYIESLKKKVYEIYDKLHNVIIYYDFYKFYLIGYQEANKKFVNLDNINKYIEYIPSIKDIITTLGFKKFYYKFDNIQKIKDIYVNRLNNIKQMINFIQLKIKQLNNKKKTNFTILKTYLKKISKINISKDNKIIFNNLNKYLKNKKSNFDINIKLNKNYSILELSELNNNDLKLINYFIEQIISLLNLNEDKFTKSNLIYFIISLIIYNFNDNFEQFFNFNYIKYHYSLTLENMYAEKEIYSKDEIENLSDDEKQSINELNIDNEERIDALDIGQEEDSEEYIIQSDDN